MHSLGKKQTNNKVPICLRKLNESVQFTFQVFHSVHFLFSLRPKTLPASAYLPLVSTYLSVIFVHKYLNIIVADQGAGIGLVLYATRFICPRLLLRVKSQISLTD